MVSALINLDWPHNEPVPAVTANDFAWKAVKEGNLSARLEPRPPFLLQRGLHTA